jgi:hypothetical protein
MRRSLAATRISTHPCVQTKSTTYATSNEVNRTLSKLPDGVVANKLLSMLIGEQKIFAMDLHQTHWNFIQHFCYAQAIDAYFQQCSPAQPLGRLATVHTHPISTSRMLGLTQ